MFTPDLETPDGILAFLQPAIRAVAEAIDDGVSFADSTEAGQRHDAHFWAHAARYRAKSYLQDQSAGEWHLGRNLPNSGIEIVCGPLVIRTLKTQAGGPPSPGGNIARRGFYVQQLGLPLGWEGVTTPEGANLILDWSIGHSREVDLFLSKPIGVWKYKGAPKLEWRQHVVLDASSGPRFEPGEEDVPIEPRWDLTEIEDEPTA